MKNVRNYDKKVKHTRILLADYLLLKEFSLKTGVSMSEALHKLIVGLKPEPRPEPMPEPEPIFRVKSPVVLRANPQPVLAINGHKTGVFVVKPKGGVIND